MHTIKAVLFDMDGLMFDTERLTDRIWSELAPRHNIPVTPEDLSLLRGRNHADGKAAFLARFGMDVDYDAFMDDSRRALEQELARHVPERPGLRVLLRFLEQRGFKLAVVSSTHREMVESNLRRAGVRDKFLTVVCGDMVPHSKPSPDIYLRAAALVGEEPCHCMVLEDSYNGVRAGAAAGCFTVMVPDLDPVTPEMEHLADAIVPDLSRVIPLLKHSAHTAAL